ncbi:MULTISPECIES: hypothetical protein [unclassified Methanosarcina]|uniref:hypothetical protein n=1 Tax=unclassified Methanosarcina TaxID=2644672 RepID=UPI0025E3D2F9|nr:MULTISPECIES: hypothetical protein [unclassified Methanosarcina]
MFSLNEQKAIELGESGERAIREQNEYDALQYVEYLREFGEELLKSNSENDLKRVVISLRNIGNKAIQKKIENVASTVLNDINSLSEVALDKNFSNVMWSFSKAAQEIGKGAVQFQMLESAKIALDTLRIIGLGAVEKKMEVVTLWTTMALEEMAYIANRQQLEDFTEDAKEAREEIIEYSEASGFVTREQIEKYPQLIAQTVSQYSELQNLQPVGYAVKPNEEFTEEEFFEEEGDNEEQEPETEAAKKEK